MFLTVGMLFVHFASVPHMIALAPTINTINPKKTANIFHVLNPAAGCNLFVSNPAKGFRPSSIMSDNGWIRKKKPFVTAKKTPQQYCYKCETGKMAFSCNKCAKGQCLKCCGPCECWRK